MANPLLTKPKDPAFGDCGLTIREYFAALAMQGNLAAAEGAYPDIKTLAEKSVEYADALISELNKSDK